MKLVGRCSRNAWLREKRGGTWNDVISALNSRSVGENGVAESLEEIVTPSIISSMYLCTVYCTYVRMLLFVLFLCRMFITMF